MTQYKLMRVQDINAEGEWNGNRNMFPHLDKRTWDQEKLTPHLDITYYPNVAVAISVAWSLNALRPDAHSDFFVVFDGETPYWSPSPEELKRAREEMKASEASTTK